MLFLYLSMYWFTLSDSKKIRKTIDKIIQGVIDRDIVLEIRKPQFIRYFRKCQSSQQTSSEWKFLAVSLIDKAAFANRN